MMRGVQTQVLESESDDYVFVSMSDLILSVMFVILTLLIFFAGELYSSAAELQRLKEEKPTETDSISAELNLSERVIEDTSISDRQKADDQAALQTLRVVVNDLRLRNERLTRELSGALAFAERSDPVQEYNAAAIAARDLLLRDLQDRMSAGLGEGSGVSVEISRGGDSLQIVGEGLFASGSSTLSGQSRRKVEQIAQTLDGVLPCFTLGARSDYNELCNPAFTIVEALQIEGHTDSVGPRELNVNLGLMRGAETYNVMLRKVPGLTDHLNLSQQPVLSVAGYGEDRPVADNDSQAGKEQNRRIDLRFIMRPPRSIEDIEKIEEALRQANAE